MAVQMAGYLRQIVKPWSRTVEMFYYFVLAVDIMNSVSWKLLRNCTVFLTLVETWIGLDSTLKTFLLRLG